MPEQFNETLRKIELVGRNSPLEMPDRRIINYIIIIGLLWTRGFLYLDTRGGEDGTARK